MREETMPAETAAGTKPMSGADTAISLETQTADQADITRRRYELDIFALEDCC